MRDELNNGLAISAATAAPGDPVGGWFGFYWGRVLEWKVESRYLAKTEAEAVELFQAITHAAHGVFPWIKSFW